MANIKGILLDKDGTLVDFQATWFAIGDSMALRAAGGALSAHAGGIARQFWR